MCTPPSLEQHEHVFRLQGDSFICKQMSVFTLMPKMKQYALEARDGFGVRSPEGPRHLHRIPRLSEAPWEAP